MSIFDKKQTIPSQQKREHASETTNHTPSKGREDRNPTSGVVRDSGSDPAVEKKLTADERRALAEATLREQEQHRTIESATVVNVLDPTVRMLLDRKIVRSDQVEEALERGTDSANLWRIIVNGDGVNSDAIYGAIAHDAGIGNFPYLDAAPTREFIDELIPSVGQDVMLSLLDRSLLPVDQEPGLAMAPFRLIVATFDPTHPNLQEYFESLAFKVECRFATESALSERLDTVRGWVTNQSRYGTSPVTSADSTSSPSGDGSSEVIDLGSYAAEDGMDIQPSAPVSKPSASEQRPSVEKISDSSDRESKPASTAVREKPPVVNDRVLDWLLRKEVATIEQVRDAQAKTKGDRNKDATWRLLAEMKGVSKEDVFREVADLYAFKHAEIGPGSPDPDFVLLTMETIADSYREALIDAKLIPYEHSIDPKTGAGRMLFVTHDPTRSETNKLLHQLDLGRFELRYASESSLHKLLAELFPKRNVYLEKMTDGGGALDLGTSHQDRESTMIDESALEAEMSRSHLINLFEASLIESVRMGASDIHFFPNPKRQIEIHFRTDGRLKKWHTEDSVHPEAFLAVIKDNSSNVDRFERDKAQDGFIQRIIDDALIRFRVSILPIATANSEIRAESIVIRILDDRKVLTDLGALGMLDVARERFDMAIRQPHGMVILTGPTGSGKSTTLVASLYQVITPEVNVLSVEDPVEYIIKGVRQIKLSHKLDLESALRSILRHDPDIVMVGEMRDKQTADLAIKLANTGHLAFSTLHTNDAPAAVSRLFKMGIEPFLIAYAINLVVAQRLIRTVCSDCRKKDENPDRVLMKSLGWDDEMIDDMTIFKATRGSGCKTCNSTGYKGRRALCETLYFSDRIRHMIAQTDDSVNEEGIRNLAIEEGMLTLQDSARVLVSMGETTVEEMLRVTGSS